MRGTVRFFKINKGYGFISTNDDMEYFVYFEDIIEEEGRFKKLVQGDVVEFDPIEEERGLKAINVQIIERAPKPRRLKPEWYSRRSF